MSLLERLRGNFKFIGHDYRVLLKTPSLTRAKRHIQGSYSRDVCNFVTASLKSEQLEFNQNSKLLLNLNYGNKMNLNWRA